MTGVRYTGSQSPFLILPHEATGMKIRFRRRRFGCRELKSIFSRCNVCGTYTNPFLPFATHAKGIDIRFGCLQRMRQVYKFISTACNACACIQIRFYSLQPKRQDWKSFFTSCNRPAGGKTPRSFPPAGRTGIERSAHPFAELFRRHDTKLIIFPFLPSRSGDKYCIARL